MTRLSRFLLIGGIESIYYGALLERYSLWWILLALLGAYAVGAALKISQADPARPSRTRGGKGAAS